MLILTEFRCTAKIREAQGGERHLGVGCLVFGRNMTSSGVILGLKSCAQLSTARPLHLHFCSFRVHARDGYDSVFDTLFLSTTFHFSLKKSVSRASSTKFQWNEQSKDSTTIVLVMSANKSFPFLLNCNRWCKYKKARLLYISLEMKRFAHYIRFRGERKRKNATSRIKGG